MDSATTVLTGFSVALIVCTVLEAASYYIYNRKVCCVVAQMETDMSNEHITVTVSLNLSIFSFTHGS